MQIVNLLNIVRHGLFCLLIATIMTNMAIGSFMAAVAALFWGGAGLLLKFAGMAAILLVIGCLFCCVGMLMCLAVPDKSSRTKLIICIVLQVAGSIVQFMDFDMHGLVARILIVIGWLYFTSFLKAVAKSIECGLVEDIVYAIRVVAGFNSSLIWMLVVAWPGVGLLIMLTIWLLDALLYSYLLFTLTKALGVYVEDVKAGRIDPTPKNTKDATLFERAMVGISRTAPQEAPSGPAPEGSNVYKAPKTLPPIHQAVKEGDRNKLATELGKGANIHEKIKNDLAPIHIAAIFGVMDIADPLIKAGARVDETCAYGLSPLYLAIQTGNVNMAGFLISKGAQINQVNDYGLTPLHWACCAPHERMTGASRIRMVQLLLEKGARVDVQDGQGKTPREIAEAQGLPMLCAALDRHMGIAAPVVEEEHHDEGIVVTDITEPDAGFTLEGADLVKLPADLPALHENARLGDTEKLEYAIKGQRADVNKPTGRGWTPLHVASIAGVAAAADYLLRNGAQVDQTSENGLTALYFAIQQNNATLVGLLLTRKANIHHVNDQGRTPLHWACAVPSARLEGQARVRLVQMLLQKGADPHARDRDGKTPRDLAVEAEQNQVVTAIDQHLEPTPARAHDEDED